MWAHKHWFSLSVEQRIRHQVAFQKMRLFIQIINCLFTLKRTNIRHCSKWASLPVIGHKCDCLCLHVNVKGFQIRLHSCFYCCIIVYTYIFVHKPEVYCVTSAGRQFYVWGMPSTFLDPQCCVHTNSKTGLRYFLSATSLEYKNTGLYAIVFTT